MIKKEYDLDYINSLPRGLQAPLLEILRNLRVNLPSKLYEDLPKLGFSIIKREDIYKNYKLYRKKKE